MLFLLRFSASARISIARFISGLTRIDITVVSFIVVNLYVNVAEAVKA